MVRSAWGAPQHNPRSRFLAEIPEPLIDWRRTEAAQTSWAPTSASSRRMDNRPPANFTTAVNSTKQTRPTPTLSPGDRVVHDSFGMGTVVSVQGEADQAVAAVDFGTNGVKRLLVRFAPVEKL
jgi:DNA helicase-2/ATP-dependent DNA helicase PcrA